VNQTKAPKSLMAAKTFTTPIGKPKDMQPWFTILSVELHTRIMRHYDEYGTWPRSISMRYATRAHSSYRSKTIGQLHKDEMKTHGNIII
jgi:DNA polymerase eta